MAEPLVIVEYVGSATLAAEEQGAVIEVEILTVYVPKSQVSEIDRNDTNRREVTAQIAAVLPPQDP